MLSSHVLPSLSMSVAIPYRHSESNVEYIASEKKKSITSTKTSHKFRAEMSPLGLFFFELLYDMSVIVTVVLATWEGNHDATAVDLPRPLKTRPRGVL